MRARRLCGLNKDGVGGRETPWHCGGGGGRWWRAVATAQARTAAKWHAIGSVDAYATVLHLCKETGFVVAE